MQMTQSVNDITLRIYDAVSQPETWPDVLDQIVELSGAHGSILFEWEEKGGERALAAPYFSGRYPQSIITQYLEHCAPLEARDQSIIRRHTQDHDAVELLDDSVLASSVEELKAQPHVRLLSSFGIFHRAAGVMNKDNRWISLFSLQLPSARQPLNADERANLALILPHLAKALDLSIPTRQLHHRYRSVLAAMDKLTLGICIIDARGMIVSRNEEFRRQQEAHRCFRISADGRLKLTDSKGQARLEHLMSHAAAHGRFGARPRKESVISHTDDVLCIDVCPLTYSDDMGSDLFGGYMLCSTDTSLPTACNVERVKDAFGLTPAETALIEPIGLGLTNPEIADRRERSVATVNAQVKSVLAKSNCANRTQFVRMITRFGARFLVDT